jgi:hypothetical protein
MAKKTNINCSSGNLGAHKRLPSGAMSPEACHGHYNSSSSRNALRHTRTSLLFHHVFHYLDTLLLHVRRTRGPMPASPIRISHPQKTPKSRTFCFTISFNHVFAFNVAIVLSLLINSAWSHSFRSLVSNCIQKGTMMVPDHFRVPNIQISEENFV